MVFDVPPSREVTWSAEKTRRYAVNKARALMAMDEAPNDEPCDNSATIDRMCSHAKKHFSPSDWDEFHHKVTDGYWKAMAGEPDDDDQAEDEPPDFPGKPKRPGVKAQDEAAKDEARQAVDEAWFNRRVDMMGVPVRPLPTPKECVARARLVLDLSKDEAGFASRFPHAAKIGRL